MFSKKKLSTSFLHSRQQWRITPAGEEGQGTDSQPLGATASDREAVRPGLID